MIERRTNKKYVIIFGCSFLVAIVANMIQEKVAIRRSTNLKLYANGATGVLVVERYSTIVRAGLIGRLTLLLGRDDDRRVQVESSKDVMAMVFRNSEWKVVPLPSETIWVIPSSSNLCFATGKPSNITKCFNENLESVSMRESDRSEAIFKESYAAFLGNKNWLSGQANSRNENHNSLPLVVGEYTLEESNPNNDDCLSESRYMTLKMTLRSANHIFHFDIGDGDRVSVERQDLKVD